MRSHTKEERAVRLRMSVRAAQGRALARIEERRRTARGLGQTRLGSLTESLTNTAVGYVVALVAQTLIFGHYGIDVSVAVSLKITLLFTVVSIVRSYVLRRFFNSRRN